MGDADWMMENGYGSMLEGEFPDGWGEENRDSHLEFDTYEEAKKWSQDHDGEAFIRNKNGTGYVPKIRK